MKKLLFIGLLSSMFISTAMAQYDNAVRTGFEGDHFSLEGALELFKDSRSVQDFERRLNTRTNWVNNLDLDYDGRTDYVRVNQRRQGNLNAIILQVPVDRRYVQDVAVIEIEQTGRRSALLQMVGDADLYGQNVVIEPYDEFGGAVNVYRWRAVRNILDGGFGNIYTSPYAFNYYPVWYHPWNQYAWNVYSPRWSSYNRFYRVSPFNRLANVYSIYSPYRSFCPVVSRRTAQVRAQRPIVNRATAGRTNRTVNRANATVTNRTTATTRARTSSSRDAAQNRATTRNTRTTTSRATTSTANRNSTRANTTRPTISRSTNSRSTTRATTTRPTVNRSTASRATASPRVSRSTSTRSSAQPRRSTTSSRANATVRRSSTSAASRTRTATPSRRVQQ